MLKEFYKKTPVGNYDKFDGDTETYVKVVKYKASNSFSNDEEERKVTMHEIQ